MNKEYYKKLEHSIRTLCYEHKYDKAKALYEDNVRNGLIPELHYHEDIYQITKNPKWMCIDWDEESIGSECVGTIAIFYPDFMQL